MPGDTDATTRLRRALDAVRHPPAGDATLDAQAMRHLFDEYAAAVQELRTVVRDAETRLRGVAKELKVGARVVRRERARVDPQ